MPARSGFYAGMVVRAGGLSHSRVGSAFLLGDSRAERRGNSGAGSSGTHSYVPPCFFSFALAS